MAKDPARGVYEVNGEWVAFDGAGWTDRAYPTLKEALADIGVLYGPASLVPEEICRRQHIEGALDRLWRATHVKAPPPAQHPLGGSALTQEQLSALWNAVRQAADLSHLAENAQKQEPLHCSRQEDCSLKVVWRVNDGQAYSCYRHLPLVLEEKGATASVTVERVR